MKNGADDKNFKIEPCACRTCTWLGCREEWFFAESAMDEEIARLCTRHHRSYASVMASNDARARLLCLFAAGATVATVRPLWDSRAKKSDKNPLS